MRRRTAEHRHVELRVELRRVAEVHGDARLKLRKVQEAAAVQREVFDLRAADDALDAVRFEIDHRGRACYGDRLLPCAHLQRDLHGRRRPDGDVDRTHGRLKSCRLDEDVVRASRQRGNRKRPVGSRLNGTRRAGVAVRHRDRRLRQHRPNLIGHGSGDGAGRHLRSERTRHGDHQ